MKSTYGIRQFFKYAFIFCSFLIAGVTFFMTQLLVDKLAKEEGDRIELWADATRELVRSDNLDCDLSFVQKVIESNHTIPVLLVDEYNNVLFSRNLDDSEDSTCFDQLKYQFSSVHEPIEVRLNDEQVQFILYDDSKLLKQLSYFPIIQISVIATFLLLSFYAFFSIQKAEQNKVWVGLSRETAHQLGTPISSLLAWNEILKSKYPKENSLQDMEKDVQRLSVIADRFSKIGSKPELSPVYLQRMLESSVAYMQKRTSNKIEYVLHKREKDVLVMSNEDLLGWVIENICKNSIDAMDGIGQISFEWSINSKHVIVDIMDTGKGIVKSKQKAIFTPGYTTKKRGWGLGLSLAKRIIEEYHKGKIFVKSSEINKGTVFRIVLNKAKE